MHFIFQWLAISLAGDLLSGAVGKMIPERAPTWIKGPDGEWYRPGDPALPNQTHEQRCQWYDNLEYLAPADRKTKTKTKSRSKPVKMLNIECNHCGHVIHLTEGKRQQLRGTVMACPSCGVAKRFRP